MADDVASPAAIEPKTALTERQLAGRPYVLVALMLALFMAAVEATVVSTAMPRIVGALGGFALYSWVFAAFLLPQAITAVLYGKLADIYGRRPMLIFGISLFLVASTACGFAWSMPSLIVFRLIQGFGAGAILPIATTIAGDLYTAEQRMKVQGLLASVWGVAAIIGPLVGGLIVTYLSWRWIFWVNVPIGILTIVGMLAFFRETVRPRHPRIDYLGMALFCVAVASLLLVVIQGGHEWAWDSSPILTLMAVFIVCLILFLWQESRAPEPVVMLSLWRQRLVAIANAATMIAGMGLIGVSSLMPTYVQGVMGRSAIVAGFTVTAMSLGWPLASGAFGWFVKRLGGRGTAILGGASCTAGGVIFLLLSPTTSPVIAGAGSFLFGCGMGLLTTTSTVMIQANVDWSQRGSATASNIFSRLLGSTLGAAILGGVLNNSLQHQLQGSGLAGLNINSMRQLMEKKAQEAMDPAQLVLLRKALDIGLHNAFLTVTLVAALSLVLTWFLPKHTMGKY